MPLLLLLLLLLSGCVAPGVSPLPSQVLSGPPLALVGQYGDLALEGALDRSCMVGFGTLDLYSPSGEFACTAALDAPPNEKGRVHGLLLCSDQTSLLFTLRNLGPDQGFAVGRSPASSDLLVFFYHPSPEEAARRFPEIFSDIRQATRLYDQETDRAPKGGSPGGERGLARP